MKKNLFKRGMAGLLSLVMCLTALVGIGTTTAYKNNPNFIVKRLDPFARVKEKCDKCQNLGYDYLVIERSKEER